MAISKLPISMYIGFLTLLKLHCHFFITIDRHFWRLRGLGSCCSNCCVLQLNDLKVSTTIIFFKFTKIKIKSFECPKSIRNYKKNNAWNIRRFVNESFVPANQQTSLLYCRLSDFKLQIVHQAAIFLGTLSMVQTVVPRRNCGLTRYGAAKKD